MFTTPSVAGTAAERDTAPLIVSDPDDADLLNRIAIRMHDGQAIAHIRLDLFLVYLAGYRAGAGEVLAAADGGE